MKIILHGTPPTPAPIWPIGAELTCPSCGCVFAIEAEDVYASLVKTFPARTPGGKTSAGARCPECQAWDSYEKPAPRTMWPTSPFARRQEQAVLPVVLTDNHAHVHGFSDCTHDFNCYGGDVPYPSHQPHRERKFDAG